MRSRALGRRVHAGDDQPRVVPLNRSRCRLGDARAPTEEEEGFAGGGCQPAALFDERDARHPFGNRATSQPRGPDERHAVGDGQVGLVDRVSEGGVGLRDAQEVEVHRHDLMQPWRAQVGFEAPGRFRDSDPVDENARQAHLLSSVRKRSRPQMCSIAAGVPQGTHGGKDAR